MTIPFICDAQSLLCVVIIPKLQTSDVAVLQLIDLGSVDSDESSGMVCGSDHTGHSSGTSMVNADDLGDLEDEMEAPADESIVDHEEPDVLDYHEEPLTEAEKQQLTVDLSTRIKYHGKEQTLKEHLNLELLGPQGLARYLVHRCIS